MIKKLKIFSVVIFVSLLYCGILGIVFNSVSSVPVLSVNISNGVDMPIIMYHSVLKDTDLSGKYIVTPDTLKNDINFLKNKGYTFVSAQELIDYTNGTSKLPEKPVMLTFDDGFYNNYGYVMPILSEYDAKAVISVVGSYTDEYSKSNIANMTYGYVRWSEVYDMFIDKRVEVGNHSYDFHSNNQGRNGSKRNSGESEDTYRNIFVDDTQKAQDRFMTKTGFAPIIYTYPFGAYSEETTDMLKSMGFKMSLTCNEGINHITDTDSLFMLKRYNRPSGISTADFFAKMGID
ncbi:MAG TPA: polysaccharide deacetylase [Clostridiales bacterium]|nr:polysaccharide deacetylase [Clostridiales bacterium]